MAAIVDGSPMPLQLEESAFSSSVPHQSQHSQQSSLSGISIRLAPFDDVFQDDIDGKQQPELVATISDLTKEPFYYYGYVSDEEAASPVGPDDMSSINSSSADLTDHGLPFPEHFVQSCSSVQQQCNQAQAVKLVRASGARIISVPKLFDIPYSPRLEGCASNGLLKLPVSRMSRPPSSITPPRSGLQSPASSTLRSSSDTSTTPSSVDQEAKRENMPRRRPSTPLMLAARRSQRAPPTPPPPPTPGFLQHDLHSPPEADSWPLPPVSPSLRKLNKFSSSLNLTRFIHKRAPSLGSSSISEETNESHFPGAFVWPETAKVSTVTAKPKLIARGASERAPPIELPPFPGEEGIAADPNQLWPDRDAPASATMTFTRFGKRSRFPNRSKSVSGAYAMM